jgi:hypothetical protein
MNNRNYAKALCGMLSKKYFFALLIVIGTLKVGNTQNSPLLTLPGNGEITLKEISKDTVYFLPIQINHLPPTGSLHLTWSDANLMSQTADKGKDYDYISAVSSMKLQSTSETYFSVGIKVYSRKIKSDVKSLLISFSYTKDNAVVHQDLLVKIEPFIPIIDKKEMPDTSKWKVRIITGSNFDFFDAPTFKNFAGDLNIFLPDLIQFKRDKDDKPGKKRSIGFQAGFFNYRYFESDSSNGRIQTDKYLLDQTVTTPTVGSTRYVNEVYALNSKTTYNTVGAYFNPMITVHNAKWIDLYANIHFETLWRTEILEYTRVSLRKDTVTLSQNDISQGIVLQNYPGLRPTYTKKSFSDIYIGIGFPVRVDVKKAFEFTVSPTVGVANYEGTEIITRVENNIKYRFFTPKMFTEFFILTKAQLVTTVSPVDIALGGEFRKISGHRTYYAVYLGAALSLDKLKK